MTVRAYLLVDAAADDARDVAEALRSTSLGNCLQLIHRWNDPQVVVRVECNEMPDVAPAVAKLAAVPGVARVATLAIYPEG